MRIVLQTHYKKKSFFVFLAIKVELKRVVFWGFDLKPVFSFVLYDRDLLQTCSMQPLAVLFDSISHYRVYIHLYLDVIL